MTDGKALRRNIEAFWSRVNKAAPNGCWEYTGFRKWDGYGWLSRKIEGRKSRYITAHRYAWTLLRGQVPEGMQVLHRCDNPPCCNPDHLFLGTRDDNMADMWRKGRNPRGERSRHAKLTEAQAKAILDNPPSWPNKPHGGGGIHELADKYGVGYACIASLVAGRTWKHLRRTS